MPYSWIWLGSLSTGRLFWRNGAPLRIGVDVAGLVLAATGAAFCGAWIAAQLLGQFTLKAIRRLVGLLLLLVAFGLAAGLL